MTDSMCATESSGTKTMQLQTEQPIKLGHVNEEMNAFTVQFIKFFTEAKFQLPNDSSEESDELDREKCKWIRNYFNKNGALTWYVNSLSEGGKKSFSIEDLEAELIELLGFDARIDPYLSKITEYIHECFFKENKKD